MKRILGLLLACVALCACGPLPSEEQPASDEGVRVINPDTSCYRQLTEEQKERLRPQATDDTSTQGNGVCVLEPTTDGSYTQHYYAPEDRSYFGDYLLYALLARTSAGPLSTMGYISGDLSITEYILLSVLTDIASDGSMRQPWRKNAADGSWTQERTTLPGRVLQRQYGKITPQAGASVAPNSSPPAGYGVQKSSISRGTAAVNSNRSAEKPKSGSTSPGNNRSTSSNSSSSSSRSSSSTGKR